MNLAKHLPEDETFRLLKKPDLHQMMRLWDEFVRVTDSADLLKPSWPHHKEKFFLGHSWTWEKFYEARKAYLLSATVGNP